MWSFTDLSQSAAYPCVSAPVVARPLFRPLKHRSRQTWAGPSVARISRPGTRRRRTRDTRHGPACHATSTALPTRPSSSSIMHALGSRIAPQPAAPAPRAHAPERDLVAPPRDLDLGARHLLQLTTCAHRVEKVARVVGARRGGRGRRPALVAEEKRGGGVELEQGEECRRQPVVGVGAAADGRPRFRETEATWRRAVTS